MYNEHYILTDPDYAGKRPLHLANLVANLFPTQLPHPAVKHLDYGAGSGVMAADLQRRGWPSHVYDPYVHTHVDIKQLGKFELITSFEVFEHVPDMDNLMLNLCTLLAENGIILFSTQANDEHVQPNQRLTWWYASPRNGHISLYSYNALQRLGHRHGFRYHSINDGLHVFYTHIPQWMAHLLPSQ